MSTNNRTPETGNRTDHISGLPTGFVKIDEMLGGLHSSELIVLASRPSMGKTALAANVAEYVSIETKRPVLFFSLEMGQTELAVRILCSRARVRKRDFASNFLDDDDRRRLADTRDELNNSQLFIDDTSAPSVSQIAAAARRIKQQNGLALIVVDYLALVEPDNLLEPRREQIAETAHGLKELARELDVPVLCLAQIDRRDERAEEQSLRPSDPHKLGSIEPYADVVLFVHREEVYLGDKEARDRNLKGKAEVIVAKQRRGSTGTVSLRWEAEFARFANEKKEDA